MPSTLTLSPTEKFDATDPRAVARLIDHTLLCAEATNTQIIRLCEEALAFGFAAVFVNPTWTALAASLLRSTSVKVGAPVGFPLGATLTSTKRSEAADLVRLGAQELDMVINVGALKSKNRIRVEDDIRAVVEIAHGAGALVKVILETGLLTVDEKILACELSVAAGADFVKTCTGFNGGYATIDDVALMRGVVGQRAGVKASGGIRTASAVAVLVEAGANRIGASASIQIMNDAKLYPRA